MLSDMGPCIMISCWLNTYACWADAVELIDEQSVFLDDFMASLRECEYLASGMSWTAFYTCYIGV